MLYILLIIIAVGVLLISEPGRWLLKWLTVLGLIAGGLYVGFWAVILAIGFFSTESDLRDNVLATLGGIVLLTYAANWRTHSIRNTSEENLKRNSKRKL